MTIVSQSRVEEIRALRDAAVDCDDWRSVDEYDKMLSESVVTIATAEVTERGLALLTEKVEKLNKRAARHGMDAMELRVLRAAPFDREVRVGGAVQRVPSVRYSVEITGCEPRINGWALAAKVEFNAIVGNVVRISPGRDDDGSYRAYRTIEPICEHCNSRRRRNDVFVLEDSNGNRKIVGRNCLADYLRSGDADDLARWAEFVDGINGIIESGGDDDDGCDDWPRERMNPAMPLDAYLRIVAVVKRKFGWMGRTAARDSFDGIATADLAARVIYGRGRAHDRWIEENELWSNEKDGAYADRAAEWAAGLDCNDENEYRFTIGQIARAGCVDMRKLDGYAASILIAYDKHCEREIEYAEKRKNAKEKVWFGTKGRREKGVRVKCVGLHSFEGQYGVTTIVRFEHYPNDTEKAVLVWFASGDKYNDWDVDAEYRIDAMIKAHDDSDKYGKQTKINRVKRS